jgi:hypothetical protein
MRERILAIYDADLSVIGELAYAVGKLTGTRSCALCDITHGLNPFGKRTWRSYCEDRPEVEWLHRNEISDEMRAQLPASLPCVIKQDVHGQLCTLLDALELMACEGQVERFDEKLAQALSGSQLSGDAALAS